MIFGFSKKESLFVATVVVCLIGATLVNLSASYRKSRDNDRKNSLGDIERRLGDFKKAIGYFPAASAEGNIIGCDGFTDKDGGWHFKECNWGENKLNSYVFDPLPHDPYSDQGRRFVYFSNGESFQLYAALEGTYEDEYNSQILKRSISCGDTLCNAGRTNLPREALAAPLPEVKK